MAVGVQRYILLSWQSFGLSSTAEVVHSNDMGVHFSGNGIGLSHALALPLVVLPQHRANDSTACGLHQAVNYFAKVLQPTWSPSKPTNQHSSRLISSQALAVGVVRARTRVRARARPWHRMGCCGIAMHVTIMFLALQYTDTRKCTRAHVCMGAMF